MKSRSKIKVGDVVRVTHHKDKRLIGLVFQVAYFSTMDYMEDCPILRNPFRRESEPWPQEPIFVRFAPDELELLDLLDRLAIL